MIMDFISFYPPIRCFKGCHKMLWVEKPTNHGPYLDSLTQRTAWWQEWLWVDCYLGELARFTIHGSPWSRSSFEIMRRFWLTSIMGVTMCQDTYLNSGPFFWGPRQRVYRKRSPSYGFPPHAPSTKDCDAYVKDIATALEAIRTFSEHGVTLPWTSST